MIPGVIADGVSSLDEAANDVGTLLNVTADQKKCGFDIGARENVEKLAGVGIVGAVVISQRQLLGFLRQARKTAPVELPGRDHGVQSGEGGGGARGGGTEDGGKHGEILSGDRAIAPSCDRKQTTCDREITTKHTKGP